MRIGRHRLGDRVLIIAEIGINHQGVEATAHALIEAAKDAGADAAKFQMFRTNAVVKRRGPTATFLSAYEFPGRVWQNLARHCSDLDLMFLASVFDGASANDYVGLGAPAIKVGSGELHDHDLLAFVANLHRPMILSTGMATMAEVKEALACCGHNDVALLHCVSAYPAPLKDVNLKAMDALQAFHCPVGYSDHTVGTAVAVAAVARGACIIEKHLTLDCSLPGPDHKASADPKTFVAMVSGIRQMEVVLGDGTKRVMDSERATRTYCRNVHEH